MSVLTITTNETNTVETMSTLSFPNSSETEYTYITNPTEFEVSTEVSSISAEVSSISTLVFPSGDGYNSILNFESNETTSEDFSNLTLKFEYNETTSEDSSNSTLISQSEDVFNSKLSKLMFESNTDNKIVTDRINITTDNSIIKPSVFPIVDNDVYDYYIKSIYDNGMKDRQWWTSYEHEFIGDAILIIDKKNGNQNGVCFIERSDIVSCLQLNKHNLARNSIFTDKNSKDNLTDKARRYLYLRYIENKNLDYKKNEFNNSFDRLNRYITNLELEKKNHLNYCFEMLWKTNLYKNRNRNNLSFLLYLFLYRKQDRNLLEILTLSYLIIVWNYFLELKIIYYIHPKILILIVLLLDFLLDFYCFCGYINKLFHNLCKIYDNNTISSIPLSQDFSIYNYLPGLILWLLITVFDVFHMG